MRAINIRLYVEDMPETIGAWSGTKDGRTFDVVLNSNRTEDQQAASFLQHVYIFTHVGQ